MSTGENEINVQNNKQSALTLFLLGFIVIIMKLREYFDTNKINISDFAKSVGCGRTTIYNIMNGVGMPNARIVAAIERETKRKVRMEDIEQIYD